MAVKSSRKPTLSVVLSFRNEEEVIEELIDRLRAVMAKLKKRIQGYELVFVNDDSTDRSLELLKKKSAGHKDIRVINMSRRFGVSPCVMAGLAYSSGTGVIYMDADLQDPPELIEEMFDVWSNEEVDVVHTKRLSRAGESRLKLWVTKMGYLFLAKVSNVRVEPEVGDFKLLSRRAVNELVKMQEHVPFMRVMVTWVGFRQTTITYERQARFAGEAKIKFYSWFVISHFLDTALISFSDKPLKASLFLGFAVSGGAFVYLIVIVVMRLYGYNLPGWSAMMVTMLMLGGIQLFTMGVLGLYINAIFLETKRRPNYIVESTLGFPNRKK